MGCYQTHSLRVTIVYVGGRTETVDTYVSAEYAGQVEIVQSAIRGRLVPQDNADRVTVHVFGLEGGLWTAELRGSSQLIAVACGTAPRKLAPNEWTGPVWPPFEHKRDEVPR